MEGRLGDVAVVGLQGWSGVADLEYRASVVCFFSILHTMGGNISWQGGQGMVRMIIKQEGDIE